MRILMLSWEYPPCVVGGLARHVAELSRALVRRHHEVFVLTSDAAGAESVSSDEGVRVYRLKTHQPKPVDFVQSVMQLNFDLLEMAIRLSEESHRFDLIHAHDWLVAYTAKVLKHSWYTPLVATIHATEYGRNYGLHTDLQRYISDVEWWVCYEAWKVICCSDYMRKEIEHIFQVPVDKLRVIPNGVEPDGFSWSGREEDLQQIRRKFARGEEKIVFFIGRLVPEKGVEYLLQAAKRVLGRCPNTKFIISGTGPQAPFLLEQAKQLGISQNVYFTGFINDEERNALYRTSQVAVFPSVYEPFGIVALEAMAAGTPVVVSNTGGLSEIVRHGVNGLLSRPRDVVSLAENILALLLSPGLAEKLGRQAKADVEAHYSWNLIAAKTDEVYTQVLSERQATTWGRANDEARLLAHISSFFTEHAKSRYTASGDREEWSSSGTVQ